MAAWRGLGGASWLNGVSGVFVLSWGGGRVASGLGDRRTLGWKEVMGWGSCP